MAPFLLAVHLISVELIDQKLTSALVINCVNCKIVLVYPGTSNEKIVLPKYIFGTRQLGFMLIRIEHMASRCLSECFES